MKHALIVVLVIGAGVAAATAQNIYPTDPGMYVQAGGGFTKIIGQIAQFTRSGSWLASTATAGIKSAKANIQLAGAHAQVVVSPQPMFYFVPPPQEAAAGVNAGDFILIRLEEKAKRRQFEIGAAGLFRASSGISLTHQIQMQRSEPRPGIYLIAPTVELNRGEYALYLSRGEGMMAYVYDFGVQGAVSVHALRSTADRGSNSNDPPGVSATAAPAPKPVAVTQASSADVPAEVVATTSHGGVLGVTGADWEEGGVKGVEIIDAADGSSARLAGLRKGYVITQVNGVQVHSTQDLARVLAQLEPGSKITVAYLAKTGLGWMPQETVAILAKGD